MIDFGNGTKLKVTIARWYTPKGRNIDKEGIEPDQKVERTEEELEQYKQERAFIPIEEYRVALSWFPTPTADFVPIRINESGQKEFLLGLRAEPPFQGKWFLTGGKIPWGLDPYDACIRHLKRELGIENMIPEFVGYNNVFNPASDDRPMWYSIQFIFKVPVPYDIVLNPNKENPEVKWFTHIDPTWPEAVIRGLKLLGFSE